MTERNAHHHSVPGAVHSAAGDQILLSYEPLNEATALKFVRDASAGATCVFVGTTRDTFKDKAVTSLEYEAYTNLALRAIQSIITKARKGSLQPPVEERGSASTALKNAYGTTVTRIHISHRLGLVPVGESSIVIAVSSPHRRESFEVAEWLLEQVKRDVPIWKEEIYAKGGAGSEERVWKANFPPPP